MRGGFLKNIDAIQRCDRQVGQVGVARGRQGRKSEAGR